jgi:hypothetical protein
MDIRVLRSMSTVNCELSSEQKESRDLGLFGCDAAVPDVS